MKNRPTYIEFLNESKVEEAIGDWLPNILKWTVFLPITLTVPLVKIAWKMRKVKILIAKEKDPNKKAKLKAELESMRLKEVELIEKREQAKREGREKAKELRKKIPNPTPEQREKLAIQKEKAKRKLEKLELEIRKAKALNLDQYSKRYASDAEKAIGKNI